MTRLGALFWILLVLASGFATFKVKYAVQDVDDELGRARKETIAEQQEVRVLNAEWTYLNQPERLADLNQRFLQLAPITAKQMQQKIADIPLRPVPAPAPDVMVETQPDAAPPQVAAAAPAPAPVQQAAAKQATAPVAPVVQVAAVAANPPSAIAAVLNGAVGKSARLQLAKATMPQAPASLNALIAQIAENR
jgi:hypothetical protein